MYCIQELYRDIELQRYCFKIPYGEIRLCLGCHCRGPDLLLGLSVWHLWWTYWQWDRVFFGYLSVLLSLLFHQCSMLINSSMIDTIKILSEITVYSRI